MVPQFIRRRAAGSALGAVQKVWQHEARPRPAPRITFAASGRALAVSAARQSPLAFLGMGAGEGEEAIWSTGWAWEPLDEIGFPEHRLAIWRANETQATPKRHIRVFLHES